MTTKIVSILIFCFAAMQANAQADMVVLKKGNKTVERYYIDSYIYFNTEKDQRWSGKIYRLKEDTIFIVPIEERAFMSNWGLVLTDTIQLNRIGIAVNKIKSITRQDESFVFLKNGALLKWLGGGYAFLNIVNNLTSSDRDPLFGSQNLKNLGIAAAVFGAGMVQNALYKDFYTLGRKYKLQILMLTPDSKEKEDNHG